MLLKRKRSESEFSSSSASTLSSPPRPADSFSIISPPHLNSRTLKRHRDNRPSDHDVHRHTLHLLYSAQQSHVRPFRPQLNLSLQQPPPPPPTPSAASAQPSLHNFWDLPTSSRPRAALSTNAVTPCAQPSPFASSTSCADCGQDLSAADSGVDGMDIDAGGPSNVYDTPFGPGLCVGCGKNVCPHCSITNLDEQRRCLSCAGPQQKDRPRDSVSRSLFFQL